MRVPRPEMPEDDGFERSLGTARTACGGMLLLPVLLLVCSLAVLRLPGSSHEEPVLAAALAVLSVLVMPVAPFVREGIARAGIGAHLQADRAESGSSPVYASFVKATIAAFAIAAVPASSGFVVAAFMRDLVPLGVGAFVSYVGWFALWPRRLLWTRWAWQARIGREGEERVL